uniref:(California timema) hypothetical protein n=1 Tax=Timema californicum TaxID=61474 RepID=A0A7R9JDU6_TIMCA|nr:unnamed protein product [Timema californicum]
MEVVKLSEVAESRLDASAPQAVWDLVHALRARLGFQMMADQDPHFNKQRRGESHDHFKRLYSLWDGQDVRWRYGGRDDLRREMRRLDHREQKLRHLDHKEQLRKIKQDAIREEDTSRTKISTTESATWTAKVEVARCWGPPPKQWGVYVNNDAHDREKPVDSAHGVGSNNKRKMRMGQGGVGPFLHLLEETGLILPCHLRIFRWLNAPPTSAWSSSSPNHERRETETHPCEDGTLVLAPKKGTTQDQDDNQPGSQILKAVV